jgi:DNA-binding response OmpR family regulator
MTDAGPDEGTLTFGDYELHLHTQELHRNGRRIRLAPEAYRLLLALTATPHAS